MKDIVSFVVVICILSSCDRYEEPFYSNEVVSEYHFNYLTGQDQKFYAGEWVNDAIRYEAVNADSSVDNPVKVIFEVSRGGGTVTQSEAYTDESNIAVTSWRLGNETCDQILTAYTYDMDGNYMTSSDLVAYAFRTGHWDRFTGLPDGAMTRLAADTVRKTTMMIAAGKLYRRGEDYFLWEEITDPAVSSPVAVRIDINGVIFVSVTGGDLLKSTDNGQSWEQCTKPFPGSSGNIDLYVSNDNYLWAGGFPLRYSTDEGLTWNETGSDLMAKGFGDIFRLSDGSLLYHGRSPRYTSYSTWQSLYRLYRSFDEGMTWNCLSPPYESRKLYVNDADEFFIHAISSWGSDASIYKSTDYGDTYKEVATISTNRRFGDKSLFYKYGNYFYAGLGGYGILRSEDFTHFETFWKNAYLDDMFIDHDGVLIVKHKNSEMVYYRKDSD